MKTSIEQVLRKKNELAVIALCLLAGILYNSWPLGYILDGQTAHSGLASDLEKVGHPYYWVFILGDVLSAFCLLGVVALIFFQSWKKQYASTRFVIAAGLLLFGLFTAIAALLPSDCTVTGILRCGADHGEGLGLDAFTSSIAAAGLLVSLIYLCLSGSKHKLASTLGGLTQATALAWISSGVLFAALALTNNNAHFAQDIFLLVTGLAIFVLGLNINSRL